MPGRQRRDRALREWYKASVRVDGRWLWVAWDAWRVSHGAVAAVEDRQRRRLADLIAFARTRSAFYCALYGQLPDDVADIRQLPTVTRQDLMANFDRWVTDPVITRDGVEAFVADSSRVGQRYLDRYAVWVTSGVHDEPYIVVQDPSALAVYRGLTLARGWLPWMGPRRLLAVMAQRDRVASVVASGSHFTSVGMMHLASKQRPWPFDRVRVFPTGLPTKQLVQRLNDFQPAELVGYSSSLSLLAREQLAGRLRIRPILLGSGGEWLTPGTRRVLEAAFHCPVRENYGASEFTRAAWDCRLHRLHLSADWVVLEPVDENHQPVPPGQAADTVLLTNLANRVQPLIRYDLGDSLRFGPDPCPCGSPLPTIQLEGRQDEMLIFTTERGGRVVVRPRTVFDLVEAAAGVESFQVVQSGPADVQVRLAVSAGADGEAVWEAVRCRLESELQRAGLASVRLSRASEPPAPLSVMKKYRLALREAEAPPVG